MALRRLVTRSTIFAARTSTRAVVAQQITQVAPVVAVRAFSAISAFSLPVQQQTKLTTLNTFTQFTPVKINVQPMPVFTSAFSIRSFSMDNDFEGERGFGNQRPRMSPEEKAERNTRTVFIGSISDNANEQTLRDILGQYGNIQGVKFLWTDRTYGIHKGVAFVEFANTEEAHAALAASGTDIDGKTIRVSMASDKPDQRQRTPRAFQDPAKTVYVGNISFEVAEDELRQAFATCGNITNIRIPKYQDTGKPRGFAYVTFDSEEAKENAMQCNGMDLGGRPLRVQNTIDRSTVEQSSEQRRGGQGSRNGGYSQRRGQDSERRQRRPRDEQDEDF